MCGRFTACFEFREIKLLFNLQRDTLLLSPRYNIAPSQEVPVMSTTVVSTVPSAPPHSGASPLGASMRELGAPGNPFTQSVGNVGCNGNRMPAMVATELGG
jgi:hypothetical protein